MLLQILQISGEIYNTSWLLRINIRYSVHPATGTVVKTTYATKSYHVQMTGIIETVIGGNEYI